MDNTPPTPTPPDSTSGPNPKPTPSHGSAPPTVVMSKLEAELAAERARVEAELAMSRADQNKFTAKKIIIIIAIVVGVFALVGILFSILSSTLLKGSGSGNNTSNNDPDSTPGQILANIEGYSCTTEDCVKVADLSATQTLIRDTSYYVFDRSAKTTTKTTIEASNFRSFTPFYWGESLLLILERTTGNQGLYSITANRELTSSYNYTSFNPDITSSAYQGMEWIEGRYILAENSDQTVLIDTQNGKEILRASGRIFVQSEFIVGYEAEGQRRFYTMEGVRSLVANAPSFVAIYDHHLIHVTAAKSMDVYDAAGLQLKSSDDYYKNLRSKLQDTRQDYADALRGFSGVFVVPD